MEQDRIKALNSNRNALEKKAGLIIIIIIIFTPGSKDPGG